VTYQAALSALADPTRREILERLRRGPLAVGEVALGLPVSRPAVSQHLRVLKDAGLVSERREGTRRLYGVSPRGLAELRRYLERFWREALDAFKRESERPSPRSGVGGRAGGARHRKGVRR
jgi:DNA-binding transcriptional ArsR family regulator